MSQQFKIQFGLLQKMFLQLQVSHMQLVNKKLTWD